MRILITGFPPFPGRPENPTQLLIESLRSGGMNSGKFSRSIELVAELLPVEYVGVEQVFDRLLEEVVPDLVLSFGVGQHRETLRLESVGFNLDTAHLPDNAGCLREECAIIPGGPAQITSTVELESLSQALSNQKIPVEISQNAGRYVCNHLLYYASYRMSQVGRPYQFLFTHVPTIENGFDLEKTALGIEVMIDWFRHGLDTYSSLRFT